MQGGGGTNFLLILWGKIWLQIKGVEAERIFFMEIVMYITNATSFHSSCSSSLQDCEYCVLAMMAIMKGGTR